MSTTSTIHSPQDLSTRISKLSGVLSSNHFPSADRAALKRYVPGQPPSMAFYRLWLRHLSENLPSEEQTQAWALIVWGLCFMGAHAHRTDQPLGKALAEQGYSEARLERLLAAGEDNRPDFFASLVRFLASKGAGFNWIDAAFLLLSRDPDRREEINRRIAANYYRSIPKAKES